MAPDPVTLTWSLDAAGASIQADVGSAHGVVDAEVEAEVRLGALRYAWQLPHLALDERGIGSVPFDLPQEAFLHDLAVDYVTTLSVRVRGVDAQGRVVWREFAPPMFVAWPSGPGAPAELWTEGARAARAPRGVVSAAVDASLPSDTVWALAPIPFETPPPVEQVEPEG